MIFLSYSIPIVFLFFNNMSLHRLDPESSRLREIVRNEYIEIHELSEDVFFDSRVYVRRF